MSNEESETKRRQRKDIIILFFTLTGFLQYQRDVVHRMNEGYKEWGALKGALSNRGLGINMSKSLYEGVTVQTALYVAETLGKRNAVKESQCS